MKITISQENSSPISITIPDNKQPEVKSQEGVIAGIFIGLALFPVILTAICCACLGIAAAKDEHKYKTFCKRNDGIIKQITEILTNYLNNEVMRYVPDLKKGAEEICTRINGLNKAFTFKINDEIDDFFKPKHQLRDILYKIIEEAKTKTGKIRIQSETLTLFYTGIDYDKLPNGDDPFWKNGDDGWGGLYDKAHDTALKELKQLKNKCPLISDFDVYIAGDDFGGSGDVNLTFIIDCTEIHKLLKNVDCRH